MGELLISSFDASCHQIGIIVCISGSSFELGQTYLTDLTMAAGEVGEAGAGEGAEEVFTHTLVLTRVRAALVAV